MPKETLDVAVAAARMAPSGCFDTCESSATGTDLALVLSESLVCQAKVLCRVRSQGPQVQRAVASPHAPSLQHAVREEGQAQHRLEETEVPELTPDAHDRLLKNHQELVGRVPLPEAEPTEYQLAALQLRVIGRGGTPYADFAVLTPCGRRLQAALRASAWLLQTDGSYKAVVVPGSPDFTAWAACWRVYKAALLCLKYPVGETSTRRGTERLVVTVSALDEYFEAFRAPQASRGVALGPRSGGTFAGPSTSQG